MQVCSLGKSNHQEYCMSFICHINISYAKFTVNFHQTNEYIQTVTTNDTKLSDNDYAFRCTRKLVIAEN